MKRGTSHSNETRLKISRAMKGKAKSDATKELMSFKRVIYWNKRREAERLRRELAAPLAAE